MNLGDFINELKHKSIFLNIFENGKIWFIGSMGELIHAVVYSKIINYKIDKIECIPTATLNIFIKEK